MGRVGFLESCIQNESFPQFFVSFWSSRERWLKVCTLFMVAMPTEVLKAVTTYLVKLAHSHTIHLTAIGLATRMTHLLSPVLTAVTSVPYAYCWPNRLPKQLGFGTRLNCRR